MKQIRQYIQGVSGSLSKCITILHSLFKSVLNFTILFPKANTETFGKMFSAECEEKYYNQSFLQGSCDLDSGAVCQAEGS